MHTLQRLRQLPERFPLACQWELTCRCNLHCVMCYTDCFNRPDRIRQELSTDEILRILHELADAGTVELCLTGGEPLARPDFFVIYEEAVRLGFLLTVFSNGTLIREEEADRFAALRPHGIEISLHGVTQSIFERVTQGPGSYQRCRHAIQLLLERQLPLTLKATAMTLNRAEILEIKQYVESLDGVRFKLGDELRPELNGGGAPFQYGLPQDDRAILHAEDARMQREASHRRDAQSEPCRSGDHRFHIDAYGGLQLCSGNRRDTYDLRTGTFREGFYKALPAFGCPWKTPRSSELIQPLAFHA